MSKLLDSFTFNIWNKIIWTKFLVFIVKIDVN